VCQRRLFNEIVSWEEYHVCCLPHVKWSFVNAKAVVIDGDSVATQAVSKVAYCFNLAAKITALQSVREVTD